ncbi:hypothetical protein ACN47E_001708 [Coniothyrium glycines]
MGSKISKAVRPHGSHQAAAIPVTNAHCGDDKSDTSNYETHQQTSRHLPDFWSHDDTTIMNSPSTCKLPQRRDSEPSRPVTTAMTSLGEGRAADFSLYLAERQLMAIDYSDLRISPTPVVAVPPPPPEPRREEEDVTQCLICCVILAPKKDPKHALEVIYPCKHCENTYCISCIKDMFTVACSDLTRMPPRCCAPINLHHARPHLTEAEVTTFKAKYEEWSTPKPFYCPTPSCSTFIPERLLPAKARAGSKDKRTDSGVGTPTPNTFPCPTCSSSICANCRQAAHYDSLCNIVEFGVDADTAALLIAWGYKQCPKCGNGVKRMFGCNHMACRCGANFCWVCLKGKDDCHGCDDEDQDDDDYSEPDEPEDIEETTAFTGQPDANVTSSPREPITTVQADAGKTDPENPATASPTPDSAIFTRVRNLDGGSHRYWEEQAFDFGSEPDSDQRDRIWHCDHHFAISTVQLRKALSYPHSSAEMDCMKCWQPIYPEIRPAISTNPDRSRTVTAGVGGRPQGIVRSRRTWQSPRGLFRANATVGTAPHLTALLSQSLPIREASLMEDVQFSSRVIDTYGNIITSKELKAPRRASLDDSHAEMPSPLSSIFPAEKFSFAHECHSCNLVVCESCRDALVAQQQDLTEPSEKINDTELEGSADPSVVADSTSIVDSTLIVDSTSLADGDDNDGFAPPSLFD